MKNFYEILGVPRTATDDEIKRSFRRLASQHHPDKGGDTQRFQEIQEAYATLSDADKRRQYDNPQPQTNFNFSAGPNFNFHDIFEMFGVRHGAAHEFQRRTPRMDLWIGLQDVARGGARILALQVGTTVSNVEISIPAGINDGDTVRYPKVAPGGQDLVVTFRIKPDPVWHRDGKNIMKEIQVSIWDLIIGSDVAITDILDNHLMLTIPPGTQPDTMLRIKGRGLPNAQFSQQNAGQGDFLVRVKAVIPREISEPLISQIRKETGQ